jgi:hypothetical protein
VLYVCTKSESSDIDQIFKNFYDLAQRRILGLPQVAIYVFKIHDLTGKNKFHINPEWIIY